MYTLVIFKLLVLLRNLKHLLMIMLVFELIGLKIIMAVNLFMYKNIVYVSLIFLILFACEASLGLSLLIGIVRCNYVSYVENSEIFVF